MYKCFSVCVCVLVCVCVSMYVCVCEGLSGAPVFTGAGCRAALHLSLIPSLPPSNHSSTPLLLGGIFGAAHIAPIPLWIPYRFCPRLEGEDRGEGESDRREDLVLKRERVGEERGIMSGLSAVLKSWAILQTLCLALAQVVSGVDRGS